MIVAYLNAGAIVAYPTEGVYGLGCDPDCLVAVERLRTLKERDPQSGFILVADNAERFTTWVAPDILSDKRLAQASVPPTTYVVPSREPLPEWLAGRYRQSLAIRVVDHPPLARLCQAYAKALISTSANPTGQEPARDVRQVEDYFSGQVDVIWNQPTGTLQGVSQIVDLMSQAVLRP